MIGIHLAVEQVHAVHLHGVEDRVYFGRTAAFRKIRDAFHQSLHKRKAYRAGKRSASWQYSVDLEMRGASGPAPNLFLIAIRDRTTLTLTSCLGSRSGGFLLN